MATNTSATGSVSVPYWSTALRALREARGVTQEGWAAQLGVGRRTLQRWERGSAVPDPSAETAILAWCAERSLFRHFDQGALAGITVSYDWLRDLLTEARLRTQNAEADARVAPPPEAQDAPRGNLPVAWTRLVGRDQDVAAVVHRLEDARILTLTGPGGVGKTRLAIAVAEQVRAVFPDGVWFVDLAPITDPSFVLPRIAQVLDAQINDNQPPLDALRATLRGKQMLVVLDNFEQVVDAAPLVQNLIAAVPGLVVLVTSRSLLRLSAERDYAVSPLALSDAATPTASALAGVPAAALFVERARAARPDFVLTDSNAAVVVEICALLDGLPLAIELAAARLRLLGPEALRTRLDQRLHLLTGGPRDLPARQQTLRDTIAWSYDLLPPAEQARFRWLSVFVGGCTLAAVEALCDAEDALGHDVLGGLTLLVEQNLVHQTEEPTGESRFRMLETVREYAIERLEAAGEADAVRARHAAFYLALAEAGEVGLRTAERHAWLEQSEREHDNLRAALSWCLTSKPRGNGVDATETAVRLAAALGRFWSNRGYLRESRQWADRVLERAEHAPPSAALARVLFFAGDAAANQSDAAAVTLLQRCVAVSRAAGSLPTVALAHAALGRIALERGDRDQALALHTDALRFARDAADQWVLARVLAECGASFLESDPALAQRACEESLAIWTALGDSWGIGMAVHALGYVLTRQGDFRRARALYEDHAARSNAAGDESDAATMHHSLGLLALQEGDYARALMHFDESLARWRRVGNLWWVASLLSYVGQVSQRQGDSHRAEACFREALSLYRETGNQSGVATILITLAILVNSRGKTERAAALLHESLLMSRAMGITALIAGCLEAMAGVDLRRDAGDRAARLLGAASSIRTSHASPRPAAYQAQYDWLIGTLRGNLGEEAFAAAFTDGQTMTLDGAVALALERSADARGASTT
jgi:predicted ATPase/transcriptional regulator with XRE-family HTH domain